MAKVISEFVSPLHVAAVEYAKLGIQVFPLVRYRDIFIVKWREVATTDLGQINQWWTKDPECNVGIVTGKRSGIVVIDFISPGAWAFAQEKGLPVTPVARKGERRQMYCKYDETKKDYILREDITGVDLLSNDRMVVVPPSVLVQNPDTLMRKVTSYEWEDGKGLGDLELGEVPDWMLEPEAEEDEEDEETSSGHMHQEVDDSLDEEHAGSEVIVELPPVENREELNVRQGLNTNDNAYIHDTQVVTSTDTSNGNERGPLPLAAVVDDWKPPVLFDNGALPEIKADLLPLWLGAFAGAISQSKQTPEGLAVMLGLSVVAACVQKKFVVAPHGDDEYTEPLSLWTVTILKSGERKSPVLNALRAPLVAWEKNQAELLSSQIKTTATAITIAEKRIEELQKKAAKEEIATERQKCIDAIAEIQAGMPIQVKAPVLWTADVTPEALQDLLADNEERMALLSDEGNIFEIMAGLYNEGRVNIDIFLQAYSGMPTKIRRRTRDVNLGKPALTFGLAVQPVVVESFANGSKKLFRGKGALGRFLFCIPTSMLGRRVAGQRVPVPDDVKRQYEEGIRGLLTVPKVVNATGDEIPRMLDLDDGAYSQWVEFDRRVEGMLREGGELEFMNDWAGKLPGNLLRIAALLHLVENGPGSLVIGESTMDRAVALCNLLIQHAKAAFRLIGTEEPLSDAKRIYQWMQKRGFEVFTRSECNTALKGVIDKDRLDNAFTELEDRNIVKELLIPTGGRSATHYISNPLLKPAVG